MTKPHYFDRGVPDADDILLEMAKGQGYVPPRCLLGGTVVMHEVNAGRDPCHGCEGPRDKCFGRARTAN
jgi:hypothetical protein